MMKGSDEMTDIVERLRAAAGHPYNQHGPQEWLTEAADEIARLRAALREIADQSSLQSVSKVIARAALEARNV